MSEVKRQYRDGGYGWVVVMSSFFIGFVTDGIPYSFGVLLVDMVDLFQTDRGKTAIAGSLVAGLKHIIGPLAGSLCESYGYRVAVVAGALVSSAGLLASVFVSRLEVLYVTFGLFCGAGFGLMYLPATVCVVTNFDKRRTLANGIAVCGSGVGMFVLNILTRYLLDMYGLRGTFLILSGICLNGVIAGLLLSDPEQVHDEPSGSELEDISQSISQETTASMEINGPNNGQTNLGFSSDLNANTDSVTCDNPQNQRRGNGLGDVDSQDVESYIKRDIISKNENTVEENTNTCTFFGRLRKALLAMWDISLLRNINFLSFVLSIFLMNFAYIIPIHLLPDVAESLQMSKQKGAFLVSAMGISNTIGRVVVGWLGDRKCVNRFVMYVGLMVCCGIFTGLSPLLITFEAKLAYAITYGLLIGGFVTLLSVVLADIVGLEYMSRAFGLVMFVIGVSAAIATPLGGWLFDITGNYDVTFLMAGIIFLLSAVIITLPKLYRVCSRRQSLNITDT